VFKVEKGVPIPSNRPTYPFAQLQVGDSFAAPLAKHGSLRTLATWYGKEWSRRFVCRRAGKGVRVWRVK
jgi:hypothetical protein